MGTMNQHENGVLLLGGDGVLRSFAPNKTVLNYAQLNAPQIQKLIDDYGRDDKLTNVFNGVNGHDVTDPEVLTHPKGEDLLPKDPPAGYDVGATAHPPTSANPSVRDLIKRPYAPENCVPAQCYGLGNCGLYCTICIVPYPGFVGNCR